MAIRSQELELVGKAEQLIAENTDLSIRLTSAVDRLVSEAEFGHWGICQGCAFGPKIERTSLTRVCRPQPAELDVDRLAYVAQYHWSVNAAQRRHACHIERQSPSPIEIGGRDEIAEMGQVAEVLRKNTLERDELLVEKEHVADRLEQQVRERTVELAQSVEELRALVSSARPLTPASISKQLGDDRDESNRAIRSGWRHDIRPDESMRSLTSCDAWAGRQDHQGDQ